MGVVVSVRRKKAFLRDGAWRCADLEFEQELNSLTTSWILATGGPPLHAKDPELDVARQISRQVRGRIILHVPSSPRASARIYFGMRQYKLAFV